MVAAWSAATSTLTRIEVPSGAVGLVDDPGGEGVAGQVVGGVRAGSVGGRKGDQPYGGGRDQQAGRRTAGGQLEPHDGSAGRGNGLLGDSGCDQHRAGRQVDGCPLADHGVQLGGRNGLGDGVALQRDRGQVGRVDDLAAVDGLGDGDDRGLVGQAGVDDVGEEPAEAERDDAERDPLGVAPARDAGRRRGRSRRWRPGPWSVVAGRGGDLTASVRPCGFRCRCSRAGSSDPWGSGVEVHRVAPVGTMLAWAEPVPVTAEMPTMARKIVGSVATVRTVTMPPSTVTEPVTPG